MNRKKTAVRTAAGIAAAVIWWGALYPELTLIPDTCMIVYEDGSVPVEDDIYRMLLKADKEQIRYKSWLFLQLEEVLKKWK